MKILSVDPSIRKSGWAFFSNSNLLDHGIIKTDIKESPIERISQLARQISDLLKTLTEKYSYSECLVIEDQYYGKNALSMKRNIEARSAWEIMSITAFSGMKIERVYPKTWQMQMLNLSQKALRKNLKAAAKFAVKHLYGKEVSEDEADAILIGHYYYNNIMVELRASKQGA